MGVFDWLVFKDYTFPEPELHNLVWQTKSLGNHLEHYVIAEDGKLYREEEEMAFSFIAFTGTIRLIGYHEGEYPIYEIETRAGQVLAIYKPDIIK